MHEFQLFPITIRTCSLRFAKTVQIECKLTSTLNVLVMVLGKAFIEFGICLLSYVLHFVTRVTGWDVAHCHQFCCRELGSTAMAAIVRARYSRHQARWHCCGCCCSSTASSIIALNLSIVCLFNKRLVTFIVKNVKSPMAKNLLPQNVG